MAQWTRREGERLLTGKGRYAADFDVPGCLDAAFVRSKVAHGLLRALDCTTARDVPGVLGAWSAADLPDLPPAPHRVLLPPLLRHDPEVLRLLRAHASPDRIVCGSDHPFDMARPDPVGYPLGHRIDVVTREANGRSFLGMKPADAAR
ncbi:hypothetical protein ACIOFV_44385 [Streptomyces mirabilis]|uniref:hypothetical protein n=1 Tax=Streptomyces mirabilis TaxID=68239 RepID=UPI0037F655C3